VWHRRGRHLEHVGGLNRHRERGKRQRREDLFEHECLPFESITNGDRPVRIGGGSESATGWADG